MKNSFYLLLIDAMLIFAASTKAYAQVGVIFTGQELLGRPTNSSVTINIVANRALDVYVKYGIKAGIYTGQTSTVSAGANSPVVVVITGLQNNAKYYYRVLYRVTGTTSWSQRAEHFFHTQRPSFASRPTTLRRESCFPRRRCGGLFDTGRRA